MCFVSGGFEVLHRYAGRFCIRASNPNFIGFLWLVYPWPQWVLISLIFINIGFLRVFASVCVPPSVMGFSWHFVGRGLRSLIKCHFVHFYYFEFALGCM